MEKKGDRVFVVGVGMTKFMKPSDNNPDYPIMAKQAVNRALRDANLSYKVIEVASVGYVYGDSTCGQRYINIKLELSMRLVCQESQSTTLITTVPLAHQPCTCVTTSLREEFTVVV